MGTNNILILYVSIGSGHRMAAEALRRGLELVSPGSRVVLFDLLKLWTPAAVRLVTGIYRASLSLFPGLYDSVAARGRLEFPLAQFRRRNRAAITSLIQEISPRVAVCTQAIPALLLADFKRSGGCFLPLAAVPTDFVVHRFWLEEEIDLYLLPTPGSREELLRRSVPGGRLSVTGIPVDPEFGRQKDPDSIRRRWGFSSEGPIVLLMGGGQGWNGLPALAEELGARESGFQVAVVSGSNPRVLRRLLRLEARGAGRLRVFGFIESIDELMQVSDIIVTKPGGLTASEALVKGVPMVLVNPIPGQETLNASYLAASGAALCSRRRSVAALARRLLADPGRLEAMRQAARALARPRAALEAANGIIGLAR